MRRIVVKDSQSLFDIAIQECGTAEATIDIAQLNDFSITDDIPPGYELLLPEITPVDTNVIKYYSDNEIIPATADTAAYLEVTIEDGDDCDCDGEYTGEYDEEYTTCLCEDPEVPEIPLYMPPETPPSA